ncbi:hypothetical protein [Rubritalea sp.]|uniref:hypothetical protein n=1 Tax=Rubritalea sp. TaxID=2109375 RepID=UPI003EF442B6
MSSAYHPLTPKQKSVLAQLAKTAFDHEYKYGLVDAPGDTKAKQLTNWRHAQQSEAVGKSSLTKCKQQDFLPLRAHFNSILGLDDKAFNDHLKSLPANDNADKTDTKEERERKIHLIKQTLAQQTKYTLGYVIAIAKTQYKQSNLDNCTTEQLHNLWITLKERIRKGDLKTR